MIVIHSLAGMEGLNPDDLLMCTNGAYINAGTLYEGLREGTLIEYYMLPAVDITGGEKIRTARKILGRD